MKKTHIKQLMVILPLIFGMLLAPLMSLSAFAAEEIEYDFSINLTDKTYLDLKVDNAGQTGAAIQVYTQDQYDTFLEERMGISSDPSVILPVPIGVTPIYITEFLYDGAGMAVSPDLDDAIAAGESYTPSVLSVPVLNIGVTGNILLTGNYTGMLAINTNDLNADVDLYLSNVNIDTDSKKAPAIYVYNKDITYTDHKVTIHTLSGTANTVKGGKFKKVSLMDKDSLGSYAEFYPDSSALRANPNYYGIYTAAEIEKIFFAKVQASGEDLQGNDPYYFYKGAGAISSDIDLYFEGEGLLEVTSLNKEGIETKGNLTFSGGTGDYYIFARDDALNTTTRSSAVSGARNTLTIDVNSLSAIVYPDATATNEGDAIDSNGDLIINGGVIYALAHPTSADDGLDSETGTYINGGTVVAVGNMSDPVSTNSTANFLKVALPNTITANTPVVVKDADGNNVIGFMTDRTYKVLTLSSSALTAGATYSIYTGGVLNGAEDAHSPDGTSLYTGITSYSGGTLLTTATVNTNPSGRPDDGGGDNPPTPPTPPDDGGGDNPPTPPTPPSGDDSGDNSGDNSGNTTPDNGNNTPVVPDNNSSNNSGGSGNNVIYVEDTDDVAVPSTSAYTVTYPSTGLLTSTGSSARSVPGFAWAVSGCSAVTLVLYLFFERKKNAVRFRR